MDSHKKLFTIRLCLSLVIVGLMISGLTAIPLVREAQFLYQLVHSRDAFLPVRDWIQTVYAGLLNTRSQYPFLFYGTDWLAFGHFAIAIAFLGPLRDPVRNIWVIQFGIFTCILVIPYALIFGALRGIPFWWQLIDCSFGLAGAIPLLIALRLARSLEANRQTPNRVP